MKFGKKTLALLLSSAMILSSSAAVLAETEGDAGGTAVVTAAPTQVETEIIQVGTWLEDQKGWVAEEGSLTFEKDKVSFEKRGVQMVTYTGKEITNEVLQFKYSIDFSGSNWGGFGVRGQSTSTVAWGGNYSYLVVFKANQIELQRFNEHGNKFLAILENDVLEGNKEADITFGSVEVNGGVQLFMYVNGKLVFNCFDGDGKAITKAGYLSFYSGTKLTVGAYDESVKVKDIPVGFSISGSANEGTLTASNQILPLTDKTEIVASVKWGRNNEYAGELKDMEKSGISSYGLQKYNPAGLYPLVEGVQGDSYAITEQDQNKYIAAYLTAEDGTVLAASEPYFYDTLSAEKEKMIILFLDYEYSLLFGEKVQIDPDDPLVTPIIDSESNRTLVPLRFIAESLGAQVEWDGETETVTLLLDETTIKMQLGSKEYSVNGETKVMDVAARTDRDRTIVPLRVISETFGKNVFWDDKGLIIISDEEPIWDSEEDADIIDSIIEEITTLY